MILYFTGTGNSAYIANELAKLINEELFSINDALKTNTKSSFNEDRLVIVCPTYAWKIPNIIRDFIKNSEIKENTKIYFVMTCGGEVSNAGKYNEELCLEKKLQYMGTAPILMPDNYIIMFKPISLEKARKIIDDSKALVNDIATKINNNEPFKKLRVSLIDKLKSSSINKGFYKGYIDPKGWRVKDNCISCGICEKKCPLNTITLTNGKPTWNNNCTHCMACISYCPVGAIEFKNKTIDKKRYTFESYTK